MYIHVGIFYTRYESDQYAIPVKYHKSNVIVIDHYSFTCRFRGVTYTCHCSDVTWGLICLKSLASRLFVRELVPTNIKKSKPRFIGICESNQPAIGGYSIQYRGPVMPIAFPYHQPDAEYSHQNTNLSAIWITWSRYKYFVYIYI